ncbi:hypothetical protein CP061683_0657, partial [Chlamydia psittaci 06-1683]
MSNAVQKIDRRDYLGAFECRRITHLVGVSCALLHYNH